MGNFVRRISVGGTNSFSGPDDLVGGRSGRSSALEHEDRIGIAQRAAWSGTDGQLYYADAGTLLQAAFFALID